MRGLVAVVTGADSGLGFEIALKLARGGAAVMLACLDPGRGDEAVERIAGKVPGAEVEARTIDLGDLGSVREFTSGFDGPLDVLVNNAGVMATPKQLTVDGFELQLGTNYLGHFALTGLLLPRLRERPEARVVTMSSHMAALGRIRLDDLHSERRYGRFSAYRQSKLANLMFALELGRRAGDGPLSVAAHPGYAATQLQVSGARASGRRIEEAVLRIGNRLVAQSAAAGARPALHAATAPGVRSGDYWAPRGPLHARGATTRIKPPRAARDRETARQLWDESERLTGVSFDAPER
jgi:NAD(P)-dependent dehydrogenase (short-subunit alcohol dehydrogenase family)